MYLYRLIHEGVGREEAETDLLAIWTPDGVWQEFIDRQLAEHKLSDAPSGGGYTGRDR